MIRDIFNTISSKVIVAVANLLIIILITNYLGADGKGEISIFILNISLVIMLNDFFGGPALVFIIPRTNSQKVLLFSFGWALIASIIIMYFTKHLKIDEGFYLHIFGVGFLHALHSISSHVLLAKEKIKHHNIVNILPILIILSVAFFQFYFYAPSVMIYVWSAYSGYGFAAIVGLFYIYKSSDSPIKMNTALNQPLRKTFKLGFWVQLGNVIQLLNYRLAFYLMAEILNKGELGRFSTAINLAESIWLINKGISAIQYSKIANTSDPKEAISITRRLLGINFVGSTLCYSLLLLVPSSWFEFIFGKEFYNLSTFLVYLAPGMIIFSVSGIFSHYFSGIGKHGINTIGALIGLVPTIIVGPYLIEEFGIKGACMVYNISYTLSTLYLIFYFRKYGSLRIGDFIPSRSHYRWFRNKIKGLK